MVVAGCCLVLFLLSRSVAALDIETNIDTGNPLVAWIVAATIVVGILALIVCFVAGLVHLVGPRDHCDILRWWGLAIVSVAALLLCS